MTTRVSRRAVTAAGAALALLALLSLGTPRAVAQSVSIGPQTATATVPPGVSQDGIFSTTSVRVDGIQVLRLAIAQGSQLDEREAQFAVSLRAQVTDAALAQILAEKKPGEGTIYEPGSLEVLVQPHGDEPILEAVDAAHRTPLPLVTVTAADAQASRIPLDELTRRWRNDLQRTLDAGLVKRQPETYARNIGVAKWMALILAAVTVLLALLYWTLRRTARKLRAATEAAELEVRQAQRDLDESHDDEEQHDRLVAAMARRAEPSTRLRLTRSTLSAIVWFALALWVVGTLVVLSLFPATISLALNVIESVIAVAAIVVVAALLNRVIDVVVQRFFLAWQNSGPGEERVRRALRTPTIVNAISGFGTVVIYFIAALTILSHLGLSAFSLLAVGGIAAVAFSLAAQNLIQDLVNGFFVLVEDQYAVGDFVVIGGHEGRVEYVTLRIVRIRDAEGGVVTIPHAQAKIVVNQSRLWSRVDYRVTIAAKSDVERALEVLRATIEAVAGVPAFRDAHVEIEWMGVEALSQMGIVLRARVRTGAGEQWRVSREIHRRVNAAFGAAQIDLGVDPTATVAAPPQ